jgi:hypothetical protein
MSRMIVFHSLLIIPNDSLIKLKSGFYQSRSVVHIWHSVYPQILRHTCVMFVLKGYIASCENLNLSIVSLVY